MKNILFFIIIIGILYTSATLTSCKKKGDTEAIVTVVDTLGRTVPNAKVTLWQDTVHNIVTNDQSIVRVSNKTDASGRATFTFANEAFLNIDAIRSDTDTVVAHIGHGFVRLQQYETVESKVILPY